MTSECPNLGFGFRSMFPLNTYGDGLFGDITGQTCEFYTVRLWQLSIFRSILTAELNKKTFMIALVHLLSAMRNLFAGNSEQDDTTNMILAKNCQSQHLVHWNLEPNKKSRFRHLVRSFPSFFSDNDISISLESTSIFKAFDSVHKSDLNVKTSVVSSSLRLTGKAP